MLHTPPLWVQCLALTLLVLLTQLANLTEETIIVDEPTFALMAEEVAQGHLPYLRFFDNKPPFFFLLLGGVFALTPETLWSLRLAGDAMLLAQVLMVLLLARRWTGADAGPPTAASGWPAFLGALLVVLLHAKGFGKHTGPELLAGALVMAGLWAWTAPARRARDFALAGLFFALAVLTRTNLAYLVLAMGFLLVAQSLWYRWGVAPVLAFGATGLAVLGGLFALYGANGALGLLWVQAVDVPLSYAATQLGPAEVLARQAAVLTEIFWRRPALFGAGLVAVLCGGGLALWLARRQERASGWPAGATLAIGLALAAILLSMTLSGAAYGYHFLQIVPFAGLLAARALAALWPYRGLRWAGAGGLGALTGLMLALTLPATWTVVSRPGQLVEDHHPIARAARTLAPQLAPTDRIWAAERHLILWYLGRSPLSRISLHPNNVIRESLVRPMAEAGLAATDPLGALMASQPDVVTLGAGRLAPGYVADVARFQAFLADYDLILSNEGIDIYRLRRP